MVHMQVTFFLKEKKQKLMDDKLCYGLVSTSAI